MSTLNIQNFATLVSNQAAAIQSRATALVDFSIGSILRSLAESNAGVGLWLQGLILQVLATARLSTSNGSDVDSFVNQFGVTRIGGNSASGSVTFGRYSATASALIPVGATVQTADGTQNFSVSVDVTNPAYSSVSNGYTLAAGVSTLTVPVVALTVGSAGNVAANSVSVMTTAIAGVDYVNNASAFSGGAASETDAALKARFQNFILGLAKGTSYGLAYAVKSTNVTVNYSTVEFYNYAGAAQAGSYYVVCDDGTGSPSASFVSTVNTAVQSVRPLGIQATTFATVAVPVNVNMTIATATGYTHSTVVGQVATLISANILAIGQGNGLQQGDVYAWAFSIPGVTGVSGMTVNSLSGDAANIAANPKNTLVPGVITVT